MKRVYLLFLRANPLPERVYELINKDGFDRTLRFISFFLTITAGWIFFLLFLSMIVFCSESLINYGRELLKLTLLILGKQIEGFSLFMSVDYFIRLYLF